MTAKYSIEVFYKMAEIVLKGVKKVYPSGNVGAKNVDLKIENGEFVVICGGMGAGKSAVMRMICGLEDVTEGEILIDEVVVNDVQPKDRDVAAIMQNMPLYPHLTVAENIAYSLNLRKMPKAEVDARVKEAAEVTGVTGCLLKKPKNLSSLERQRVLLARSVARRTKIIMADEPFKGLDEGLKNEMRSEMVKLCAALGINFIVSTRSFVDAVVMADKIAYMENGEIVQYGTPEELYNTPLTVNVASYFGRPKINIMDGRIENGCFVGGGITVPLGNNEQAKAYDGTDKKVYLAVRSEDISEGELFETDIESVGEAKSGNHAFSFTLGGVYHFTANGKNSFTANTRAGVGFNLERVLLYDFDTEKLIV